MIILLGRTAGGAGLIRQPVPPCGDGIELAGRLCELNPGWFREAEWCCVEADTPGAARWPEAAAIDAEAAAGT